MLSFNSLNFIRVNFSGFRPNPITTLGQPPNYLSTLFNPYVNPYRINFWNDRVTTPYLSNNPVTDVYNTYKPEPPKPEKNPNVSTEHCLRPSDLKKKPNKFKELNRIFEQQNQGKEILNEMRLQIQSILQSEKYVGQHAEAVGRASGTHLRRLLKLFFEDGERALEKTIGKKPCEYSPIVFGSTARDDGGAYPDLDYAMLIEKKTPENLKYFEMLSQYVADRIHQLGEATAGENYGIHACYGGATPFFRSYGWRYANPDYGSDVNTLSLSSDLKDQDAEVNTYLHGLYTVGDFSRSRGTATFIAEPHEFAAWTKPHMSDQIAATAEELKAKQEKSNVRLEQLIKNAGVYTECLAIDPTPAKQKLVDRFVRERQKILQNRPEEQQVSPVKDKAKVSVRTRAQELFAKTIPTNALHCLKKLPIHDLIDIKKDFWRFPQTLIAYLCQVHGITETNSFKRIRALVDRKIISNEVGQKLSRVYGFLVSLRSKCQMHYKCEIHEVFPSEAAKQAYLNKLEEKEGKSLEEALKECKQEIEALHDSLGSFNGDEAALKQTAKERTKLFDRLEELNHSVALKEGLVLTPQEKGYFQNTVIPFLNDMKDKVFHYVKEGRWKFFG
jgi:predicted nucleotidyltransferase